MLFVFMLLDFKKILDNIHKGFFALHRPDSNGQMQFPYFV